MGPDVVRYVAVKCKGSAHAAAVAREELDAFGVFAVVECIGATAGAEEFLCFGVDGDPLEPGAGKNFQRFARCPLQLLHFAVVHPPGDAPIARQSARSIVDPCPHSSSSTNVGSQAVLADRRHEGDCFADHLGLRGTEFNTGLQLRPVLAVGAALCLHKLAVVLIIGGMGKITILEDQHLLHGSIGPLPGAGQVIVLLKAGNEEYPG